MRERCTGCRHILGVRVRPTSSKGLPAAASAQQGRGPTPSGGSDRRPAAEKPETGPASVVEVRNRFDGRWSIGYEIAEADVCQDPTRYRIRRRRDGAVLPSWFRPDEVRMIEGPSPSP